MLVVSGVMKVDGGKIQEYRAAMKELVSETRKEAGCRKYCVTADLEEEFTFHIIEEWDSQEALNGHLKSPHMAAYVQKAGTAIPKEGRKFKIYQVESSQDM